MRHQVAQQRPRRQGHGRCSDLDTAWPVRAVGVAPALTAATWRVLSATPTRSRRCCASMPEMAIPAAAAGGRRCRQRAVKRRRQRQRAVRGGAARDCGGAGGGDAGDAAIVEAAVVVVHHCDAESRFGFRTVAPVQWRDGRAETMASSTLRWRSRKSVSAAVARVSSDVPLVWCRREQRWYPRRYCRRRRRPASEGGDEQG